MCALQKSVLLVCHICPHHISPMKNLFTPMNDIAFDNIFQVGYLTDQLLGCLKYCFSGGCLLADPVLCEWYSVLLSQ